MKFKITTNKRQIIMIIILLIIYTILGYLAFSGKLYDWTYQVTSK